MHYKSIFISDTHFGYPINQSKLLANFLQNHTCDNLYLVGDIIDFWALERKFTWKLADSHAVQQMLNKRRSGVPVIYITGNHDEFIRQHLDYISFEGIKFVNEVDHVGVNGKKYLVIHGDIFDNETAVWDILSHLGNGAYMSSLYLSKFVNWIRGKFGLSPWSISLFLKQNVKGVVNYINKYEKHMIDYCKRGQYDGVITGHIHTPCIKQMDGLEYYNCGDWVESCTALVEHMNGRFEIVKWDKMVEF